MVYRSLFNKALRLIVLKQKASSSMLQKELGVGYLVAGKILDQLEEQGIVSHFRGSLGRLVYIQNLHSIKKDRVKKAKLFDEHYQDIFPKSKRL